MEQRFFCRILLFAILTLGAVGCHKQEQDAPVTPEADLCARNLQNLANTKKTWAEANSKTADDTPTAADLMPYIRRMPACPAGGTYTLGKVGEAPTCSVAAHNEAYKKLAANPNP